MNKEEAILIPLPRTVETYNAAVRCDMAQGPSSCGAWHKIEDWSPEVLAEIKKTFMGPE